MFNGDIIVMPDKTVTFMASFIHWHFASVLQVYFVAANTSIECSIGCGEHLIKSTLAKECANLALTR